MVRPTDQQVATPVVSPDVSTQPEVATPEPVVVSPVVTTNTPTAPQEAISLPV